MSRIVVIDYGMGNLRSVQKALEVAGAAAKVTDNPRDIASAAKIVFPGVGAFGDAMRELKRRRLVAPLTDAIAQGKYFLGLCLGMQLLFASSEEAPGVKGLGVIPGRVKKFRFRTNALKIPQMGWNTIAKSAARNVKNEKILTGVPDGSYMYFVHSYYAVPKDKKVALTMTRYGIDFVSGVGNGNVYGFQFHPEKSQDLGLQILRNFVKL